MDLTDIESLFNDPGITAEPLRILIHQYFVLKLRLKYWILILTPDCRDPIIRVIAILEYSKLQWPYELKSEKSSANL